MVKRDKRVTSVDRDQLDPRVRKEKLDRQDSRDKMVFLDPLVHLVRRATKDRKASRH